MGTIAAWALIFLVEPLNEVAVNGLADLLHTVRKVSAGPLGQLKSGWTDLVSKAMVCNSTNTGLVSLASAGKVNALALVMV